MSEPIKRKSARKKRLRLIPLTIIVSSYFVMFPVFVLVMTASVLRILFKKIYLKMNGRDQKHPSHLPMEKVPNLRRFQENISRLIWYEIEDMPHSQSKFVFRYSTFFVTATLLIMFTLFASANHSDQWVDFKHEAYLSMKERDLNWSVLMGSQNYILKPNLQDIDNYFSDLIQQNVIEFAGVKQNGEVILWKGSEVDKPFSTFVIGESLSDTIWDRESIIVYRTVGNLVFFTGLKIDKFAFAKTISASSIDYGLLTICLVYFIGGGLMAIWFICIRDKQLS